MIVAPHGDDEIVGCHNILAKGLVNTVLYPAEVMKELGVAVAVKEFGFRSEEATFDNIQNITRYARELGGCVFFPDPIYEWHPDHRKFAAMGEQLLHIFPNIVFYNVNMTAPYIRKVTQPHVKRKALDFCYSMKKSLWEYDHKYFLFEGYNQWVTPKNNLI
jgi:LmbE family N-acetylglucosaminyl deacetylase